MKILVVGDPHGKLGKIKKLNLRKFDLILCTGDLGKSNLTRKLYLGKTKKETRSINKDPILQKNIWMEFYNSSLNVLRKLSKSIKVYSVWGNVFGYTDYEMKKMGNSTGLNLPPLRKEMKKLKNFNLVKNQLRNIHGLRVGFIDYFVSTNWVKDFAPKDKNLLKKAKKKTQKIQKILNRWKKLDILLTHVPPYGILDKVTNKYKPPKNWIGKHAGSKIVLEYIKKYKPRYVLCGHIHEAKGKTKLGKTTIINTGCCGNYYIIDV